MAKKQPIPAFCRGTVENLTAAISEGGRFHDLDRILWCYINEGERVGELAFVMPPEEGGEPAISYIAGNNTCNIAFLESFPDSNEAKIGTLYIIDNKGYHYNGSDFIKLFDESEIDILRQAVTEDSENLHDALDAININVADLFNRFDSLSEEQSSQKETINNLNETTAELQEGQTSQNERLDILENRMVDLDSISDKVDTLETDVSNIHTDIYDINNNLSNHGAMISDMDQRITDIELSSDIDRFTQLLREYDARIESAQSTSESALNSVSDCTLEVQRLSNTVDSFSDTITDFDSRISNNTSDIRNLQITVESLDGFEQRVENVEEAISGFTWEFNFDE